MKRRAPRALRALHWLIACALLVLCAGTSTPTSSESFWTESVVLVAAPLAKRGAPKESTPRASRVAALALASWARRPIGVAISASPTPIASSSNDAFFDTSPSSVDAKVVVAETLHDIGLAALQTPEDRKRFAEALMKKGGLLVAVGRAIKIQAILHGAKES